MQVASTALDSVSNIDLENNGTENVHGGGGEQPMGADGEHGNECTQEQLPEQLHECNWEGVAAAGQEAG